MSSFYTTGDTKLKGKPLLSNDVSAPVWEKIYPFLRHSVINVFLGQCDSN